MVDSERTPWWGPIAGSIGFLTVIPVPSLATSPSLAGRSAAYFPLVGTLIGVVLGGLGLAGDRWLPAGPVAVAIIAGSALITGGLHFDGLMDSTDGLFGGRTPERRLAIMRDSRVGSFGVIAGALALLGHFACLSELTGLPRFMALVAAVSTSRWAMLLALILFPAARDSGAGATFRREVTRPGGVAGTLFMVTLALLLGPPGVMALAVGAGIAAGCGYLITRLVGGLTGDSYGAIAVLTELGVLYGAVALAAP